MRRAKRSLACESALEVIREQMEPSDVFTWRMQSQSGVSQAGKRSWVGLLLVVLCSPDSVAIAVERGAECFLA